jgi:hypothetical protein
MKPKKRGRPPRSLLSKKEEDRERYLLNFEIAQVVFEAVLNGKPYRDGIDHYGALTEGVEKARALGIKLSQDGVEALIEHLRKDPESLYKTPPAALRDTLARLAAGFSQAKEVIVATGKRKRAVKVEAYIPKDSGEKTAAPTPRLKIAKKPPGT